LAKFEIMKSTNSWQQQFYWHLKADNGEIIARGEMYVNKQACIDCVNKIKQLAPNASVVDLTGTYY
jgi:uncharacterized protein